MTVFFTVGTAQIFDQQEEKDIDSTIRAVTKNEKKYDDFSQNLINVEHQATLKEVLDAALQRDYVIKQAREKVRQMKYRTKETESGLYPAVNANAGYGREMQYQDGITQNFYDEKAAGVEARQMVFDGGVTRNSVRQFERLKQSEDSKYHNTLMEQSQSVIEAYLGVVFDQQAVKVNIDNMKKLETILENVRIKVESGAASMTEESSIAASFADANKTLVKAKSKLVDSINYFEYVTSIKTEQMMPYEHTFPIELSTFGDEFRDMEKNNPKLQSLRYTSKSKVNELNSAKAEYMPQLDIVSDYAETQSMGGGDGFVKEGTIGMEVTVKIFDGFARDSKISRIQSELSESIYALEQERKKLKWDSEKLYNSVMTLNETLDTSETELESREQQVEAYWNKFWLSTQDLNILLLAQKQLRDIKLDRLNYLKNRSLDYFKLLSFQGRLLEYFNSRAREQRIKAENQEDIPEEQPQKETKNSAYIHESVISIEPAPDGLQQVVINTHRANLRGGANLGDNIVSTVKKGQRFKIISKHGEWYRVEQP